MKKFVVLVLLAFTVVARALLFSLCRMAPLLTGNQLPE